VPETSVAISSEHIQSGWFASLHDPNVRVGRRQIPDTTHNSAFG